jgi:hypothetical protein
MIDALHDLLRFMKARKKYWLVPLIVILVGLGVLLVFGGGTAAAPFIYSLF